jgi:hypothetical protein
MPAHALRSSLPGRHSSRIVSAMTCSKRRPRANARAHTRARARRPRMAPHSSRPRSLLRRRCPLQDGAVRGRCPFLARGAWPASMAAPLLMRRGSSMGRRQPPRRRSSSNRARSRVRASGCRSSGSVKSAASSEQTSVRAVASRPLGVCHIYPRSRARLHA